MNLQIQIDRKYGPDTILPIPPDFRDQKPIMNAPCKHPKVRVVAREEDAEYVECQECGDVFESSELKDMAIEEKKDPEDE